MPNLNQLRNSFRYAFRGLRHVFLNEQNFRIQLFFCLAVILLIFLLKVDLLRAAVLFLLCVMVLILELLNTVAERVADLLQPRLHHYVEVIKDLMAAAVFIASLGAVIVGTLLFWPYLIRFMVNAMDYWNLVAAGGLDI